MLRLTLDPATTKFLGLVLLGCVIYTCFELTPSSYGLVLTQIGAPEAGPILGTPRAIRADEWAFSTPILQAAVRVGLKRINTTSFYQEDLRAANIPIGLPLKDWGLWFKPEMWLYLVAPPAIAFSAYFALMMAGCLAGYQLLLRQIGVDPLVAAIVSVLILFSGFFQFWWTTFAGLLAGFPWILLIVFSSLRWWQKALLYSWSLPVWLFADPYPPLFADLLFVSIVVVLAIRPSLLRSPREWAAIGIGGLITGLVFCAYFIDVIPIMRNTVYPGHRIAEPGTATLSAIFSQMFPTVSFSLSDFRNLAGKNICEIGAVGSFLPLLTLCLTRFDALKHDLFVRRALMVLGVALIPITWWQIANAPRWLGRILLWDWADAPRLLLGSGLLILIASILVWRDHLISAHPGRILLFALIGPVASVLLKRETSVADYALSGGLVAAALIACLLPPAMRALTLLTSIALANICVFARFNPLQPADPIFEIPQTDLVEQLRFTEDSSPDHLLVDSRYLGATLNGLGFRSVNHALSAPGLSVFQRYFPAMDRERFNFVFNRFGYIGVTDDRLPDAKTPNVISVPSQAFQPVRNLRSVVLDAAPRKDCSLPHGGVIDRVAADGDQLIVEGWAPWEGEDKTQELHVVSARPLRAGPLLTIKRPDVAEKLQDYAFDRSGFRLTLSSADGRPFRGEDVILVANRTVRGRTQLAGCGCP